MWLVDTIPFGHHSNGQNGCLFRSEVRDASDESVEPVPVKAVNRADGSFSTNYIKAMVFYGRLYLDSAGAGAGEYATRREWRVGAGVQVNPRGYIGGSIDPELSRLYGPTRALVGASAAARGVGMCARLSGDAGLFVRLHDGQDYYNLGFAERITRLQFGVTLQRDQFLSFRISPL